LIRIGQTGRICASNGSSNADQSFPQVDLESFSNWRSDETGDDWVFQLACDGMSREYGYPGCLSGSVWNRKILIALIISLLSHCIALVGIFWLPNPHAAKRPPFLTLTLIGRDSLEEGATVSGGGNAEGVGELFAGEVTASLPVAEVESDPVETPKVSVRKKPAPPFPEQKPRPDRKKKPAVSAARVDSPAPVTLEPVKAEQGSGADSGQGRTDEGASAGDVGGMAAGARESRTGDGRGAGTGPVAAYFGSPDGPRFLKRSLPNYPETARRLDKEGQVVLQLTIDERGALIDIQLIKRAGFGFDEEAVKALRQSSFCPAKRDGRPVVCRAILPVRFVLKSGHDF